MHKGLLVPASFVEIGEDHGGMCFGDGVQYATGCTLGKGNLEKTPYGKLAVTIIERACNRAIRISYTGRLTNQPLSESFLVEHAADYLWPAPPCKDLGRRRDNDYKGVPETP